MPKSFRNHEPQRIISTFIKRLPLGEKKSILIESSELEEYTTSQDVLHTTISYSQGVKRPSTSTEKMYTIS